MVKPVVHKCWRVFVRQLNKYLYDLVAEDRGVRAWRNRDCLPRLYAVTNAVAPPAGVPPLAWAGGGDFLPDRQVLLNDAAPPMVNPASTQVPDALRCTITAHGPRFIEADVEAPVAAYVVFSETWYPGWRVEVDGQPSAWLRANGVMQATAVSPGIHRVRFLFAPRSLFTGSVISVLTLLAGVIWARRPAG